VKPEIIHLNRFTQTEQSLLFELLNAGEVIAYPTDTIYGLGVDIYNPAAVAKLQHLKGRESRKPFSVLYPSVNKLLAEFDHLTQFQKMAVQRLMPGMVTLLLPVEKEHQFPAPFVSAGLIGVRVVDLPELNRLLADYPHPISSTSINPAGAKPATSVAEIERYFGFEIPLIIDNGNTDSGQSSTIIKITGNTWEIIREGAVSKTQVEECLGSH